MGPAGILGIAWCIFPGVAGFLLLANIKPMSDWLNGFSDAQAVGIYVGIFIITAGCGFLPTYAQAVLGGWIFGTVVGVPAALAGFTGGSLIGGFITKVVSRNRVEHLIEEDARVLAIREALIGHGFWRTLGIVTLIRIPPNSPFAITNFIMASAGVRLLPYTLGTLIGMAPRTIIAVSFAAAAAESGAEDIQSFVKHGLGPWWLLGGIVVMLIVLGIIGAIANKAIDRVVLRPGQGPETEAAPSGSSEDTDT